MDRNILLNKIYKIAISILSILLGALMILFVFTIYFNGKAIRESSDPTYQIYTREIVGKYLGYLLIPFILWVLVIIAGLVINYLFPINDKKKIKISEIETYFMIKHKIPLNDENYSNELKIINNEQKKRKIGFIIVSVISLLCMIFPARYLFNFSNFTTIEMSAIEEAKKMVLNVFPWIIGAFVLFGGYIYYMSNSIKKELNEIRNILKTYKSTSKWKMKKTNILHINIVRACIGVVAVVFIVLGIFNGGVDNVIAKAVNICTECIGLA